MLPAQRARRIAPALLVLLGLTACGHARTPVAGPSAIVTTDPTSPPAASVSDESSTPAATSSAASSAATSSAVRSSAAPSTSARSTVPPVSTAAAGCTTDSLTVQALRGSGAAGHQFASLQFTNSSKASCSITGFPGAVLMVGGHRLGQPAVRTSDPVTTVTLAPGASAESLLTNNSTCNAAVSDSVQIIVPNRTEAVDVPLRMRGCAITVNPVAAA